MIIYMLFTFANLDGKFSETTHKDKRKMHCCLFCKEWLYRMPRHFKTKHKNESQIQNILELPKKEQIKQFTILRRKGDLYLRFSINNNLLKSSKWFSNGYLVTYFRSLSANYD